MSIKIPHITALGDRYGVEKKSLTENELRPTPVPRHVRQNKMIAVFANWFYSIQAPSYTAPAERYHQISMANGFRFKTAHNMIE